MSTVHCKVPWKISMSGEKRRYMLEKGANVLGAILFLAFAAALLTNFMRSHRLSTLLSLLMVSIFVFFFLKRDIPKQINLSLYDWFIALYGTFLTLFLRPAPTAHDSILLTLVQAVGTSIAIAGMLSLNKSFGLVAANRGVKTYGLYKYVRHPIYAGYFLNLGAFWAQNLNLLNSLVLFSWMTFEILRLFAEERILSQDPAYVEYKQRVHWRMLPFVF